MRSGESTITACTIGCDVSVGKGGGGGVDVDVAVGEGVYVGFTISATAKGFPYVGAGWGESV